MPRTIRFHLDENGSRSIAEGLRRRGIDVTTTPDARLMGATDEQQAAYGLAEGRVLFTQDQDLLRLDAEGVAHAGVAYCAKDTKSVGDLIQALVLIWEVYKPEEMAGRVEHVVTSRRRRRPGRPLRKSAAQGPSAAPGSRGRRTGRPPRRRPASRPSGRWRGIC